VSERLEVRPLVPLQVRGHGRRVRAALEDAGQRRPVMFPLERSQVRLCPGREVASAAREQPVVDVCERVDVGVHERVNVGQALRGEGLRAERAGKALVVAQLVDAEA